MATSSVAYPDPGSGAFLTPGPGSGIGLLRIPDLGSRIPNPYFLELSDKFSVKKFYNSLETGLDFFLPHFKNKIIFKFVKFLATKKGMTTNFFSPLSFFEVFVSGIRDPRSGIRGPRSWIRDPGWVKNQNLGSGINILDPQPWLNL